MLLKVLFYLFSHLQIFFAEPWEIASSWLQPNSLICSPILTADIQIPHGRCTLPSPNEIHTWQWTAMLLPSKQRQSFIMRQTYQKRLETTNWMLVDSSTCHLGRGTLSVMVFRIYSENKSVIFLFWAGSASFHVVHWNWLKTFPQGLGALVLPAPTSASDVKFPQYVHLGISPGVQVFLLA